MCVARLLPTQRRETKSQKNGEITYTVTSTEDLAFQLDDKGACEQPKGGVTISNWLNLMDLPTIRENTHLQIITKLKFVARRNEIVPFKSYVHFAKPIKLVAGKPLRII